MADEPVKPATTPPAASPAPPKPTGPTINIGDEFGTAKRNLPPARIVSAAIAGILVLFAIFAFLQRAKPQASGSLDNITAVAVPGQTTTLVAFTFTLHNTAEKPLWVHTIEGKAKTTSAELDGEAVSAIDLDRYFQAFPALKVNAQPPLSPEDKLQPGQSLTRTVVVGFPVAVDDFNRRQSASVVIQPYDQPVSIVLTK